MILAGLAGMLFSTLFSIAVVNFMGDQVIAGTAINMIAPALSFLVVLSVFNQSNLDISPSFYL